MIARVAAVLAVVFALSSAAHADKVAVVKFTGKRANQVQKQVELQLKKRKLEVVKVDSVDEAEGVTAVVTGRVFKKKKRWRVEIEVLSGADGASLGTTTLAVRKLKALPKQTKKMFWKRLGKAVKAGELARAAEEPEPEEEQEEEPEPDPEPAAETREREPEREPEPESGAAAGGIGTSVTRGGWRSIDASATVTGRVFSRSLGYKDDLFAVLPEYDAPAAPALALAGDYYPWKRVGFAASYSFTREFESRTNAEVPFPTRAWGFSVGARARATTGSITWRGDVDYGGQSFLISDSYAMEKPAVPNVAYRFVRAGGAALYDMGGKWSAGLGVGYRHLLSLGEIETGEYFPRLSAAGVDGELWIGFQLARSIQVRAGVDVERYFYTMNPEPGDPRVAGGAIDQFLGAYLGMTFRP